MPSFLRETERASDRCVTHATFVQWEGGKDGPSESRDSPRARYCLLPAPCSLPPSLPPSDSDVGNFYDISHCHDDDGLDGAAGLPPPPVGGLGGTGRVRAIVRFRSFERPAAAAEGESRKGKERLESCNAQTATTNA